MSKLLINNKTQKIRKSTIKEHDLVRKLNQEFCTHITCRSLEESRRHVENSERKRQIQNGEEKVQQRKKAKRGQI